jgi:predicted ABC-type ATPase
MAEAAPKVVILAGPNRSGKTTAARSLLAETLKVMTFVNADVLAQGLAGFDPDGAAFEASRIMLHRLHKLADERADFAFETMLAARSLAGWLGRWQQTGYKASLVYFWLASADPAVERVAKRVRMGGHNIPETTVRQRYRRCVPNFFRLYRPIVSAWRGYDNTRSGTSEPVAQGGAGGNETVFNSATGQEMQKANVP